MPHIRVRGIALEDIESISDLLIKQAAELLETPADHFTLEYQAVTYFVTGGASSAYPFFEILWFDRGEEIKRQFAKNITDMVQPLLIDAKDVCVVFHDIKGNNYFENGESF
ncbi:DUF1904 domain-containing protein [Marinomonas agarivorans]|nr:DUF1904 domain-containing protein [Marinomonas agarivorans]